MALYYRDRSQAGEMLATHLRQYAHRPDVLVLGLPRGGVPVADQVARALGAPLDVIVVRKLGFPGNEELAMGAIASGGVRVLNDEVLDLYPVSQAMIDQVAAHQAQELAAREHRFRGDRPYPDFTGRTVILVDDGLATGSTMRAAVAAVRQRRPQRIVVAVPVAAESTCEDLRRQVDELVCPNTPEPFFAVGAWYEDFAQTTDDEVAALLARAKKEAGAAGAAQAREAKHG